jgi:hypothetical protein
MVKRIDIVYGGERYSVGGRDVEALKDEIVAGTTGSPRWLHVNDGEGAAREALLLLSPGIPIAIIPIPDEPVDGPIARGEEGAFFGGSLP